MQAVAAELSGHVKLQLLPFLMRRQKLELSLTFCGLKILRASVPSVRASLPFAARCVVARRLSPLPNEKSRSSDKTKKSSHGGHGVQGGSFGEARLKTGIRRLINRF